MMTETFLAALTTYTPVDQDEGKHRDDFIRFVSAHRDNWWSRANPVGHVTGSAWILNSARTHALLLHHVKLDLWVQPGGHLDDADISPAAGAMREAMEETGIARLNFASESLFDVDVHSIPARARGEHVEPAHLHYDARYLIIADSVSVSISAESRDAKWIALNALAQPPHERSIARMAEKSLRLNS